MDPQALGFIIDKYGLPLTILGMFGWLLVTRRLILGSEKDRSDIEYQKELDYREARRAEERDGRLEAEAALRTMATSLEALSESVDQLSDLIAEEPPATTREDRRGTRR